MAFVETPGAFQRCFSLFLFPRMSGSELPFYWNVLNCVNTNFCF